MSSFISDVTKCPALKNRERPRKTIRMSLTAREWDIDWSFLAELAIFAFGHVVEIELYICWSLNALFLLI